MDTAARDQFIKLGLKGVPAFSIGDDIVVGLDQQKILALVDHRAVSCPGCGVKIRVPLDKGKRQMECPKCKSVIE